MPTNCILYARVSTDEQSEGPSLDAQMQACREYAATHGMVRVAEFKDDYTGTTLERPGFTKVLELLASGKANALIVHHHDRLSRNYIDFLILRDQFEKANIELHFVNTGKAQQGFEGLLVQSIHALMAHGERERILSRSKMGKDGKALRGEWISQLPYGYIRNEDGELEFDEEKIELIRQIFHWAAYGDDETGPLSLYEISKRLNDMGVPPPYNGRNIDVTGWASGTIWRMLKNEFFAGTAHYGKTRQKDGVRSKQPKSNWIPIDVPPAIDKRTFALVQKQLKKKQQRAKRNRKRTYMLSGHIRCGSCGWAMTGRSIRKQNNSDQEYSYYICGRSGHTGYYEQCDKYTRHIRAREVDMTVVAWLFDLISEDERLIEGLELMQEKTKEGVYHKQERIDQITKLINDDDLRITRLVTRLGDIADDTVAAVLVDQIKTANKRKEMLGDEKQRLLDELEQLSLSPDVTNYVLSFARELRKQLKRTTAEDIRTLLDILDVYVHVFQDADGEDLHRIKISCAIPDITGGISLPIVSRTSGQTRNNRQQIIFTIELPLGQNSRAPTIYPVR